MRWFRTLRNSSCVQRKGYFRIVITLIATGIDVKFCRRNNSPMLTDGLLYISAFSFPPK
jgi:hypothetical protein